MKLTGQELAQEMEEHARAHPEVVIRTAWVKSIDRKGNCFLVHTGEEVVEATRSSSPPGPDTENSRCRATTSLATKGVQYCALCDRPL